MAPRRRVTIAAAVVAASCLAVSPALAGSCFEDVGCPGDHAIPQEQLWQLGCEPLWTLRNSIYHDNGYCFKTQKALQVWSNEGCLYENAADVPLNGYESGNISAIKSVEQQKGCL
jgi:hypothetical protein